MPKIMLDGMFDSPVCKHTLLCKQVYEQWYNEIEPGKIATAMTLNTTYDEYLKAIKKIHKGSTYYALRKAEKEEFVCKPFNLLANIENMIEINTSKPIRQGRPMDSFYSSEDKYRKFYKKFKEQSPDACPFHYDVLFGCFSGDKVVGYIRLRRMGNFVQYAQLLGHGDYLKDGIMYLLHFHVMKWIFENTDAKYLWYSWWNRGKGGVIMWKRKVGFEPYELDKR